MCTFSEYIDAIHVQLHDFSNMHPCEPCMDLYYSVPGFSVLVRLYSNYKHEIDFA